jgi:hypothetical protein
MTLQEIEKEDKWQMSTEKFLSFLSKDLVLWSTSVLPGIWEAEARGSCFRPAWEKSVVMVVHASDASYMGDIGRRLFV